MPAQRLPPLRPAELKQSVPMGSNDPRRDPTSSIKLSLEQGNAAAGSCRAIHALWNQDVKEITLRMYRVESSFRASQEEATRHHDQREEDMHKLRAKVYVLEEKVHVLQSELQDQRREHHNLRQDLRTELHHNRELLHQMTGEIQALKDDQVLYVSLPLRLF